MRRGWRRVVLQRAVPLALAIFWAPGGRPAVSASVAPQVFSLGDLLALAARRAPEIRAAQAETEAARGDLEEARRWPDPAFAWLAGRGRGEGGESGTETDVGVEQFIPRPRAYRAGVEAASGSVDLAEASAEAVRDEVEQAVKEQFYGLLLAEKLLEVLSEHLEAARGLEELTARRASLGEAREIDRLKAKVERLTVEGQVRSAEVETGVRRRNLDRYLLGALGASFTLGGDLSVRGDLVSREALLERLRGDNSRLREARARVRAGRGRLDAVRAARFPGVSFSLHRVEEIDKESSWVGAGVTVPLWNAARGRIARAASEAAALEAREEAARVQVESEFEAAYGRWRFARERSSVYEAELLPAARGSLEIARFSYEQGATSLLDLLDARRVYLTVVAEAHRTYYEHFAARAALERILGGPVHER
jgi:cobalt-zinc-cadmium efflux system outer membrane protein